MFRRGRNDHETERAQKAISPIEGRPLSFRYPEAEDTPERTTRIPARYLVESPDGTDYNVTELIMGRTVTNRKERMMIADVNVALMDMSEWVADQSSPRAPRTGKFLIEYPREKREDPIDGIVITAESSGLGWYDVKEVNNEILVTGRRDGLASDTTIDLPRGTRTTASVRARVPAGEYPTGNATEQTYEEKLMEGIRDAIVDYNETHPKN